MIKPILNCVHESPLTTWPPAYKIKKHRRARHVKLKALQAQTLQLTVPFHFNLKLIPEILEANKAWIMKHLSLVQSQHVETETLPTKITMHAMNESWNIDYIASKTKLQMIERPHAEMSLVGNIEDHEACRLMLLRWIKEKAKSFLITQIDELSVQLKLPYNNITIRNQQTLWGSCTANKSINLNYKLVFLPNNLVRHILIHELCHTKYLNHSEKFWNLVASHDEEWQANRKALRKGDHFIPEWISSVVGG